MDKAEALTLAPDDVVSRLETTEHGLSRAEAAARLRTYGANALTARSGSFRCCRSSSSSCSLPSGPIWWSSKWASAFSCGAANPDGWRCPAVEVQGRTPACHHATGGTRHAEPNGSGADARLRRGPKPDDAATSSHNITARCIRAAVAALRVCDMQLGDCLSARRTAAYRPYSLRIPDSCERCTLQ
ncbi:MAG: cation-transporting P-type ATPase [Ktedonobacterales bacterium]